MILMAGLQGSGKTTACGKLARHLREEKSSTWRWPPATSSAPPPWTSW